MVTLGCGPILGGKTDRNWLRKLQNYFAPNCSRPFGAIFFQTQGLGEGSRVTLFEEERIWKKATTSVYCFPVQFFHQFVIIVIKSFISKKENKHHHHHHHHRRPQKATGPAHETTHPNIVTIMVIITNTNITIIIITNITIITNIIRRSSSRDHPPQLPPRDTAIYGSMPQVF